MATETKYPDAILAQSGWSTTPAVTSIDDDPDAPSGDWILASGNTASPQVRVSFPTPSGDLTANTQTFKAWVRKHGTGTGTPTVRLNLYEGGTLKATGTAVNVTNATGQLVTQTFSGLDTLLSDPTGASVEILVVGTVGGSGGQRASIDLDAVNWDTVDYTPPPPQTLTLGAVASPAAVRGTDLSGSGAVVLALGHVPSGEAVRGSGLADPTDYFALIMARSPLAYWPLDEPPGLSDRITDVSGNAVTGATPSGPVAGVEALIDPTSKRQQQIAAMGSIEATTGTNGWFATGTGTVISRDTTEHHGGTASIKTVVTAGVAGDGLRTGWFNGNPLYAVVGQRITAEVWVKGTAGHNLVCVFAENSAAHAWLATIHAPTGGSSITLTGDWQLVSWDFNCSHASCGQLDLYVQSDGDETFWIDDFKCWTYDQAYAYSFDGTSDYIAQGSVPAVSTVTVEAWIRANSFNATDFSYKTILYKNATQNSYWLRVNNNGDGTQRLAFYIYDGAYYGAVSTVALSVGLIYHVAATYDGTTIRLYVNGVAAGTGLHTGSLSTDASGSVGISDSTNSWDGVIDEVVIYDHVLTEARVLAHYTAGKLVIELDPGAVASEEALHGPDLSGSGAASLTLDNVPSGAALHGLGLTPGAVALALGLVSSAQALHGIDLATGAAPSLDLGHITTAELLHGPTILGSGAVPLLLGAVASAEALYGIDLSSAGILLLGKVDTAELLHGPTLDASGSVALGLGQIASAETLHGLELSSGGSVLLLGRVASGESLPGLDLIASGLAALGLGRIGSTAAVRGPAIFGSGAVALGLGHAASEELVRGLALTPHAAALLLGHVASAAALHGLDLDPFGAAALPLGKILTASLLHGPDVAASGAVELGLGAIPSSAVVNGVRLVVQSGVANAVLVLESPAVAIAGDDPQIVLALTTPEITAALRAAGVELDPDAPYIVLTLENL